MIQFLLTLQIRPLEIYFHFSAFSKKEAIFLKIIQSETGYIDPKTYVKYVNTDLEMTKGK